MVERGTTNGPPLTHTYFTRPLQAWSAIVYRLIPNVQQLEMNLDSFAVILEADEVLLFERATFLVSCVSVGCSTVCS